MSNIVNKELYSQFLLASVNGRCSSVWLADLLNNQPAHDTFTRWLTHIRLRPRILWDYSKGLITDKSKGYLIVDDTVLDKWYSDQIDLVYRQYSGTHHRVVKGIGVTSFLWNGEEDPLLAEHITVDFRVYSPKYDGKTKHLHCREMITQSFKRGFSPEAVVMDTWYADIKTFKLLKSLNWTFVSGIEKNRIVTLTPSDFKPVAEIATTKGTVCHLKAFGFIKVFKIVHPENGDIEYLATNRLSFTAPVVKKVNARRWKVEEYHRGLKQTTNIENCQARNQRSQRNHILCSLLTFLALEKWRLETGCSWYLAKQQIVAHALKKYLEKPFIPLPKNQYVNSISE